MGDLLKNTKADTLLELSAGTTKLKIEDFLVVTANQFTHAAKEVCRDIAQHFGGDKIVVRSSTKKEGVLGTSIAGHHLSLFDLDSSDEEAVEKAIGEVFASYDDLDDVVVDIDLLGTDDDKVLVQRQTTDIKIAGVVFTRDIAFNRPYYVVTYKEVEESGLKQEDARTKTRWIAQNVSREFVDLDFWNLIVAVREIQELYSDLKALDVEFFIKTDGTVVVSQVKPLIVAIGKTTPMSDREFKDTKAFAKCNYLDYSHILSDKAYLSTKETLGNNPRNLNYSLLKELITGRVWNDAITPLGYSRVEHSLTQKVGGKPYISITSLMEALTPENVSEIVKYKLQEYYEKRMIENKDLHGEVEEKLILNCYDLNTEKRLAELPEEDFSREEVAGLKNALYEMTRDVVDRFEELSKADAEELTKLSKLRREYTNQGILQEKNAMKLFRFIDEFCKAVKEHGTTLFMRQARISVIARNICYSMVDAGYFAKEEMDAFLHSIPTASTDFIRAFDLLRLGQMSKEDFDLVYGNLRPQAYDIRSSMFKELDVAVEELLMQGEEETPSEGNSAEGNSAEGNSAEGNSAEENSAEKKTAEENPAGENPQQEEPVSVELDEERLRQACQKLELFSSKEAFLRFVSRSLQNKNHFQLEISKSLSLLLEVIVNLGELLGIAREDMSYLDIQDLVGYHSRDSYIQIIEHRRNMFHAYNYLVLPDVILNAGDIDVVDMDYEKVLE